MIKKFVLKLVLVIISLQIIFIADSLSLKSAQPIKIRGHTTGTNILGTVILTCDCTVTEDLDCSCIIMK